MRYLIGIISPLPPSIKVTMVLYEDERDKYPPFPDLYMHCVQRSLSLTINNINSSWLSNSSPTTASASNPQTSHPEEPAWSCSEKQRQVILSLARKNGINNSELHDLAVLCFGKGASQLNKLEASSLINELIEKSGGTSRKAPSFGSCARLQEVAAPEMR